MIGPGSRLAHYEVVSALGKGGMGEVWRAKDTKLGREVAIKTLPPEFAQDADRLARFEREAKVLASLNHPNIAAIYGLEQSDDTRFLVLELIEGDTLADRLQRGAIPIDESLQLALQIAEALEVAHEKGVIHRDLKPANIKVTQDGNIKILDFGLAKAFAGQEADASLSNSPTLSMAATQQGVILGTAGYMSPEQASGEVADHRADVWAFGVVLFEMLTGRQLFTGKNVTHILADVVKSDPKWDELPGNLNPRLRLLLEGCLEKEPKDRLSGISDARVSIQKVLADPSGVVFQPVADEVHEPQSKPTWIVPLVLGMFIAASVGGLASWYLRSEETRDPARFVIAGATNESVFIAGNRTSIAISPDGQTVGYLVPAETGQNIYIRQLGQLEGRLLDSIPAGGKGDLFFSPDGASLAFATNTDSTMKRVSTLGGPAVTITDVNNGLFGASWGADDTIVFAHSGEPGLQRVSAAGGDAIPLTTPEDGQSHRWPSFLPDQSAVLFTVVESTTSQIAVLDLETNQQRVLIPAGSHPRYVSTGHILYGAEGTLRVMAFDSDRLEVSGNATPVLEGVASSFFGGVQYDIADNGSLIYVAGGGGFEGVRQRLLWVDRNGNEEAIAADPQPFLYPRISPEGNRVALDARGDSNDIWIWDFVRETLSRFVIGDQGGQYPVWTPDGDRIAYNTNEAIYWKAANNTGTPELLSDVPVSDNSNPGYPAFFSPDGSELIFRQPFVGMSNNIGVVPVGGSEVVWLLQAEFSEINAELSPDGRWMAYQSNESTRPEIYVAPFPDVDEDRIQISNSGGFKPLWSRDGRELFYLEPGSLPQLISVPVDAQASDLDFIFGPRTVVMAWPYMNANNGRNYDVSLDGSRFLVLSPSASEDDGGAQANDLRIILNWTQELLERVPVP